MTELQDRRARSIRRRALASPPSTAPRPGTSYARGSRTAGGSALRLNAPDGSLTDPVFWVGTDNTSQYDYSAYGVTGPRWPYNTYNVGGRAEWGPSLAPQQLTGAGILPAVTRATSLVIGPVIRSVWKYYRRDASLAGLSDVNGGSAEIPRPLWIADPQLVGRIPGGDAPRPTLPYPRRLHPHAFWSTLATHALWFGNGALLYAQDGAGIPLAGTLRIVNPMRWGWTDDGRFALGLGTEEPMESDDGGVFDVGGTRWAMRLLQGPGPHDGEAIAGALLKMGLVLSTAERTNRYLNSILANGVPTGVLKVSTPNFNAEKARQLKAQWMDAHGGVERGVAVLASTIDYAPLQLSVVDADAVAAKGALLLDIAHGFNLSAAMLDAATGSNGGNLTYSNLSDRRRETLEHSLADMGHNVEDFMTALMPYGHSMKIDWSTYVNTDPSASVPYITAGLAGGWLTMEEVRDMLGLAPLIPGGTDG